jgi:D-3-phosphoglycerate dehydrogenase
MAPEQWTVLLPETIDPAGPESIRDIATFTHIDEYDDRAALLADVGRYDAVVVRVTELSADLLAAADSLQVVAKHGAGLDNVDVEAATERGIVVCNTPGANSRSVAEHALALALAVRRRVLPADAHVRDGGWERHRFASTELTDDTVGLFGFGDIARETAALLEGFGATVLAYDPYVGAEAMAPDVEKVGTTDALFERSDLVSVHAPLTEATRGAIGAAELAALGPGGSIVNTSRGGIVDEDALLEALESGAVAGAGLDVFAEEPPAPDDPLLGRDDVVVTPHVGGLTDEALERMSRGAAANVRTVYEGGIPESTVNAEALHERG